MRRHLGLTVLAAALALCGGAVWLALRLTAEYPALEGPVFYPVNQVEGFCLSLEEPTWSPFRGYTLDYSITADSEETYYVVEDGATSEGLEMLVDRQWYRLSGRRERLTDIVFDLGGKGDGHGTGLESSLVQKYDGYGTRLHPGTYRLTVELTAGDGTDHVLAAEFEVE